MWLWRNYYYMNNGYFQGREEGQLWYPRKVAVIRSSGKFVVCDRGNERSRMQIFTRNGHFVKKIAIRYIDIVAGLAITQQGISKCCCSQASISLISGDWNSLICNFPSFFFCFKAIEDDFKDHFHLACEELYSSKLMQMFYLLKVASWQQFTFVVQMSIYVFSH